MNAQRTNADANANTRITTAFLLGWSISELFGRYRKGVRPPPAQKTPRPADYARRLDVSNGSVEHATDSFLFAAQRVVQFYRELGYESDEQASALTKEIYALPQKIDDWLEHRATSFYPQRELRDLLNDWTMQVWARLDGESAAGARAFTAGMSLADTYWYMRLPRQRPKGWKANQSSEEDWRRLLSKYRLDIEQSRLRTLQSDLPRYVVPVIRQHLQAWSIGTELVYQNGRLTRDKKNTKSPMLEPDDETALQEALARQVQNWEAMLFGLREATTFLWTRDRRLIPVLRFAALFGVVLVTALFLLVVPAIVAYLLALGPLPLLLRLLTENQAKITEWLAVVSLLWTILVAVPVPIVLRAAYQFTRSAQQWLDDKLTVWFIARRTLVMWAAYMG
ncbi:MAG: hypothetical protein HY782_19045 [Chloroflexi bacterium]|nr:hypothetical protein [Chloroflexota bacterium]